MSIKEYKEKIEKNTEEYNKKKKECMDTALSRIEDIRLFFNQLEKDIRGNDFHNQFMSACIAEVMIDCIEIVINKIIAASSREKLKDLPKEIKEEVSEYH
jgi:hypothetical protein